MERRAALHQVTYYKGGIIDDRNNYGYSARNVWVPDFNAGHDDQTGTNGKTVMIRLSLRDRRGMTQGGVEEVNRVGLEVWKEPELAKAGR